MEDPVEAQHHPTPKRKSIKINTVAQPASATNSPAAINKPRKSILKNSNQSFSEESTSTEIALTNDSTRASNCIESTQKLSSTINPSRPHNIEELVRSENLNNEITSSTLNLEDICEKSEDIWIVTLPKLIDPQQLCGQTITLGDKSKFKIREEQYCTVAHDADCNVTCVLKSGEKLLQYKTVNIKPTGSLTVRRKLPRTPKIEPVPVVNFDMQIPENLKPRHPLLGVVRERKRRSRKRS